MVVKHRLRIAAVFVLVLVLLGAGGSLLISRAIDEQYSGDWYSASTENARYRHVYVKSPVVVPSRLCTSDSTEAVVTDAWIEKHTHVEYRWRVRRHEVQDSLDRLVIHVAQASRDSGAWRYSVGRGFVGVRFALNGKEVGESGNANVHTLVALSPAPFPDTIRLSALRTSGRRSPCGF